MTEYVNGKNLKTGYTTGACAAAAAGYASLLLFSELCGKMHEIKENTSYTITLPNNEKVQMDVCDVSCHLSGDDKWVSCGVKKDAGDDPDITDGIVIYAKVSLSGTNKSKDNIIITGGTGIGTVTKEGLDRPVGDAAINSVPREMIKNTIAASAESLGLDIDKLYVVTEISAPGGEELAKKTFNPKLGIEGGISILGTTGIVHPMSRKALVDAIKAEASVLAAYDRSVIYFVPGNYGECFSKDELNIPDEKIVKCSNFIGEAIDAAVELEFKEIIIIGHFGKLVKLSSGIMNTHSREADGRLEALAACVALSGGDTDIIRKILHSNTADEAVGMIADEALFSSAMELLCERIEDAMRRRSFDRAVCGAVLFPLKYSDNERLICFSKNARYLKDRKKQAYKTQEKSSDKRVNKHIIYAVGIGPGSLSDMTIRARDTIAGADIIVGYKTYIDIIRKYFPHKEYYQSGMTDETGRVRKCLDLANEGKTVALVCSGDAGVYALTSLLFELREKYGLSSSVRIIPVCGVTAAISGAALLGSPLTNDFSSVSLSDRLTDIETIKKRIKSAAMSDMCMVLYNPKSHGRRHILKDVCDIILEYKDKDTVCGIASRVGREGETARILTLEELYAISCDDEDKSIDMQSVVFIGNSDTKVIDGAMITRRGYHRKYD